MDHGQADRPATGAETDEGTPGREPAPLEPAPLEPAPLEPAPLEPAPLEPAPPPSVPVPSGPRPSSATGRGTGAAPAPASDKVGPTRLSAAWTAAVVAIVLVVAMLIFILQNEREVPISFVSAHGHLPLGIAMLFSAVVGAVIVVGCGTARILQLRRMARRRARAVPRPVVAPVPPTE